MSARELSLPRYRSNSNPVSDAWFDLREGLTRHTLWINLGLQEVKQLYRGSLLGAAWIVVSFLVFGAGLIWFFGALSSSEAAWFAAYLLLGLWVYQFIATSITGACTVFIAAEGWLRSQRLPISLFAYKLTFRNVFNLALTGISVALALIYVGHPVSWGALWAIPGILMIVYTSVWVSLLLGIVTARFRDLQHIVATIMRFAFLMTPVLWVADELGTRGKFANINPLTHYIAIVREPLLNGQVVMFHWWLVLAMTIVGTVVTFGVFARFRRDLIFWL